MLSTATPRRKKYRTSAHGRKEGIRLSRGKKKAVESQRIRLKPQAERTLDANTVQFIQANPPDRSWWTDPFPSREAFAAEARRQTARMARAPVYRRRDLSAEQEY